MLIDTSFDFRTDAGGKDPDVYSTRLRKYHKLLWSKPLPSGRLFDLDDTVRGVYLHHRSDLGVEYLLSSDSVIPTFTRWGFAKSHPELYSDDENGAFMTLSYTIGGMMVFPGNRVEGKWTINQARGCLKKISDRLDLTVECIRRHYAGHISPLGDTLARYDDFFALFEDFTGYVDFFLLHDLVASDGGAVAFFMPFDDFKTPATPQDDATYREYRRRSIDFIEARIVESSDTQQHDHD